MPKTYYLKVYGCQMNQYEAGTINTILEKAGYIKVENEKKAKIVLLLTCSVRNHAEVRALGRLASLANPKKITAVLGCMAENKRETLITDYKADLVVGPDKYRQLPELLKNFETTHTAQIVLGLNQEYKGDCYEDILPKLNGSVTGFVSIMRGCNNYCSYCIVPYVRGPERSKNYEAIIREIENQSRAGVKDITLIGQNVLAYQSDGMDFCQLIKKIDLASNIARLRFITAHPKDFNERVINTLANLKKFCPGIHLPLQSGSNRILQSMNRHYTREDYWQKIQLAKERIPEVTFTTDLMVGYPTETEADFTETLDMVQRIRFDYAYMYQYSPRPQTRAPNIKPLVDPKVAHERLKRLITLQNQITKENNQALIGKEFEVMIESHKGNQSLARTRTNKVVIIDKIEPVGKIVWAKITGIRGWTPVGHLVKEEL